MSGSAKCIIGIVVAIALAPVAKGGDLVALVGQSDGSLVRLNITAGGASLINNLGGSVTGLAFNPDKSILFGAVNVDTNYPSPTSLYTINPITGASNLIGATGQSITVFTALSDGRLVGVDKNNDFYRINSGTGAATLVGSTGVPASDQAYNSLATDGTTLYYTFQKTEIAPPSLYTLDPDTGSATLIGQIDAGGFGGGGGLPGSFFVASNGHPPQLLGFLEDYAVINIDTQTAHATVLNFHGDPAAFGGVDISDKVPEPSGATVAILAAAIALLRRRATPKRILA
jgi:hypothetical protein